MNQNIKNNIFDFCKKTSSVRKTDFSLFTALFTNSLNRRYNKFCISNQTKFFFFSSSAEEYHPAQFLCSEIRDVHTYINSFLMHAADLFALLPLTVLPSVKCKIVLGFLR